MARVLVTNLAVNALRLRFLRPKLIPGLQSTVSEVGHTRPSYPYDRKASAGPADSPEAVGQRLPHLPTPPTSRGAPGNICRCSQPEFSDLPTFLMVGVVVEHCDRRPRGRRRHRGNEARRAIDCASAASLPETPPTVSRRPLSSRLCPTVFELFAAPCCGTRCRRALRVRSLQGTSGTRSAAAKIRSKPIATCHGAGGGARRCADPTPALWRGGLRCRCLSARATWKPALCGNSRRPRF